MCGPQVGFHAIAQGERGAGIDGDGGVAGLAEFGDGSDVVWCGKRVLEFFNPSSSSTSRPSGSTAPVERTTPADGMGIGDAYENVIRPRILRGPKSLRRG